MGRGVTSAWPTHPDILAGFRVVIGGAGVNAHNYGAQYGKQAAGAESARHAFPQ
jgi:hypothetical protein